MYLILQIPHEIGDYAILIQSGVSPMKAKLLQSLTAIGALLGCIVALLAQGKQYLTNFLVAISTGEVLINVWPV